MTFIIKAEVTMTIDAIDEDEALSVAEDRLIEIDKQLGMFSNWSDPIVEDEIEDSYE